MKQTILISLLLWGMFLPIMAQTGNYYSQREKKGYVYLKDGTVLKGKYLYAPDLMKIKVVTKEESRIYDSDAVDKVSKNGPERENGTDFVYQQRRFTSITEAGILFGSPDNDRETPFILSTSLNYLIIDGLSAGIGTGVEFYHGTYLPVTANVHYRFGTKRISPFAMIQAGYLINLESDFYQPDRTPSYSSYWDPRLRDKLDAKGGLLINPSVGAIIETDYGFGFSLSVGYRFHRLNYNADENDYHLHIDYNRLSLKLGIIF